MKKHPHGCLFYLFILLLSFSVKVHQEDCLNPDGFAIPFVMAEIN